MTGPTDVLVVGAGATGLAAARAAREAGARVLLVDKAANAPAGVPDGVDVHAHRMVVDVVLSEDGAVAGALVADPDAYEVQLVRARAIVLATGGASGIWSPTPAPYATGDGLAIAHRAGAYLEGLTPVFTPRAGVEGGVVTRDAGAVTGVPGLHAAGAVSAGRVDGVAAGAAAVEAAPESLLPLGPYAVMPNIDSPLPKGFADVKLQRLRDVMTHHLGPEGPRDLDHARLLLHQIKGEADEFARARVDLDLLSLKNACEVAVLVARSVPEAA